jgi:selenocysteine lyase/cysteine desulfurase
VDQRDLFDIPSGVYLQSHSVGCLPRAARDAAEQFFQEWAAAGGQAWPAWLGHVQRFRSALAGLLGGKPEEFCPQLNLSSGLTKLIGALPRRTGRNRLVLSELDFPTIGFVLQAAARCGYEVEFIPAGDGTLPPERWIERLGPEVQLAHVTHVLSENSYCTDIAPVMQAAHERGVFVVVDVAQSAGVVPIDCAAWDAVAVTGSCVKWLCGGPGAGWLWVRSDLVTELEPTDVGWFSHANPFEFDIRHFTYAPDAQRFWGGTPSPLPYALAAAGIELMSTIGVATLRAHNLDLTERLRSGAVALGFTVNTPADPAQHGGTLAIDFPDRAGALAELERRGIRVDSRPRYGLRFSPHIYNSADDIEYTLEALRAIATSGPPRASM